MRNLGISTQVVTNHGILQGKQQEGVCVFHGVPFAQPPVGKLRFKSPVAVEPWSGVRLAEIPAPASYQMNLDNSAQIMLEVKALDPGVPGVAAWPSYVGETYNQPNISEDCLYLDIWTPETTSGAKLPVYLYYHGGANAVSSGSFPLESGANLAREENIIVVRPNYRLGALGWVHFGLISDALPDAVNLGLQDQLAALKWVHDNITDFGGDPDNITIGGESCGATAVSHLLCYAAARPYFKRAILQSLSPFNVWCTQQKQEAVVVAEKYLELLEISDPADLMEIDPDRLLAVQNILTRFFQPDANVAWRPLGGVVDGEWIPVQPSEYLSSHPFPAQNTQLMIGFAKDEWQFFRGHSDTMQHGSEQEVLKVLAQVFGEKAKQLYDSYKDLYPTHVPGLLLSDIMSFEFFKFSSLAIARNFAASGIPTYVFEFAFDLPGHGGYLKALHTGDMPFLWRNFSEGDLRQWPSFDGIDRNEVKSTSDKMGKMYASFIRSSSFAIKPMSVVRPWQDRDRRSLIS